MKVSLIIPCYNESKSLPELLKNCQEAFYGKNIEVVIVDNGSTDNTQEILEILIKDYPFVTLVKVEKNLGYGNGILQGLQSASGEVLGWTHADLQTNPDDVNKGLLVFEKAKDVEKTFVKGERYGRSFIDVFFTVGMALFESILLKTKMWDINAQPTLFHKSFFNSWVEPPNDFSLDLFAYYMAKKKGLCISRFPVVFSERVHGISNWNVSFISKYHFIKRTLIYSFGLQKRIR